MAALRSNKHTVTPQNVAPEETERLDLSERDLTLITEILDNPPAPTEAFLAVARQVFRTTTTSVA